MWTKEWPEQHADGNKVPSPSTSVTLGSRFGDWRVCWLGGWEKHRMYYLVMLVKVTCREE